MAERLHAFVERSGWGGARLEPLAGDASARRYWRVWRGAGRAVLMDAPPSEVPSCRRFVALARWLCGHGLSAPRILAAEPADGLILMEDLGDALFARVCAQRPAAEATLYRRAVEVLLRLCELPPPADLPPYDRATSRRESRLVTEWYLPAATGRPVPAGDDEDSAALDSLIADALALAPPPSRPVCVLRDYHAENLLWLPARAGLAQVGLLDFQDALAGHPAYDLVSLLEDARRDTPAALRAEMRAAWLAGTGMSADALDLAMAVWGAQRNLKILGIFARLWLRDGKPGYLELMPRVWEHLLADLAHPALAPLARFVARHLPPPDPATRKRIRSARR